MLNIIKMDLKSNYFLQEKIEIASFVILGLLLAMFFSPDRIGFIVYLNVSFIVLYMSVEMNKDKLSLKSNAMIQSLPIRRLDYVIAKYLLVIINHIIGFVYIYLVFFLLGLLGYEHIKYINMGIIIDIFRINLLVFSIILLISFLLFNQFRIFLNIFILISFLNHYEIDPYGYWGLFGGMISIVRDLNSLLIPLAIYIFSGVLSYIAYRERDLI